MILIIWLICLILSYIIVRISFYCQDLDWTIGDRWFMLITSILGPLSLLIIILICTEDFITYLKYRIHNKLDNSTPTKW